MKGKVKTEWEEHYAGQYISVGEVMVELTELNVIKLYSTQNAIKTYCMQLTVYCVSIIPAVNIFEVYINDAVMHNEDIAEKTTTSYNKTYTCI